MSLNTDGSSSNGGDPAQRVKLNSVRKSFLSALYGIHVRLGTLDLSKTLAELGIDDQPPLTPGERSATVRMVLQARSGVYHAYVGGLAEDRDAMPARGSHPSGTFWYYNNWDFNVLGTIFEQQAGVKIDRTHEPDRGSHRHAGLPPGTYAGDDGPQLTYRIERFGK